MKTNKQKTKVVGWEANHYTPNNYGVTKSVMTFGNGWDNVNYDLYDLYLHEKLKREEELNTKN